MATTSPHITPNKAADFTPSDVKYGLKLKLCGSDIAYTITLVTGGTAYMRIVGGTDAARARSRAYIAHHVKLGNFTIID